MFLFQVEQLSGDWNGRGVRHGEHHHNDGGREASECWRYELRSAAQERAQVCF